MSKYEKETPTYIMTAARAAAGIHLFILPLLIHKFTMTSLILVNIFTKVNNIINKMLTSNQMAGDNVGLYAKIKKFKGRQ